MTSFTNEVHRVLETLRAAMNWGMAQTPPLFSRSPFHRFGVRLNKKAETARDRRLTRDEQKRLLDTALHEMNTPEQSESQTASTRSQEGRERNGIENSSNGSTSAGTTCVTKAHVACSRIASTSASSN